ncbi:MAG: S8 family serine peptidase [Gammaproteobacteria bacterium]|nr:S8 family serine peptidase [Gammaproteobacteria bacterium]NVK87945.1 S8 family serine peptidase [Gammaproteobacteria bacterium]
MTNVFRMTTLTACVLSSLTLTAAKQGNDVGATGYKGEDGLFYQLQSNTLQKGTSKIDAKLQQLAAKKSQDELLDVIIFVKTDAVEKQLKAIDKRYQAQLEDLSKQLKSIDLKYRPAESLSEKQEQEFMQSKAAMMTAQDKQVARATKKELDDIRDQARQEKAKLVEQIAQNKMREISDLVRANGGKIQNQTALNSAVGAQVSAAMLEQIANYPAVTFITVDAKPDYEVNVSVPSARYNTWHSANFDGYPYDFGVVDTGVRENHPAFVGNNFCSKPGSSVTGDHGTHVAGIVISDDATYKGTAPGTDSVIWANSGNQSTTMSNMQWMLSGTCQGPEVVNHSLGYGVADDTDYSVTDAFYDAFVQNYNVMVTKSTGNSGWSDSAPRITHPAPAYNLMAVANMNDRNTTSRTDDVRSGSSSVGPTLNGRRKPDIAAPGSAIMSTNSDWQSEADFISKSGTSMAAPHVAGAIILMEDGGNHTAMAQKAVLINTADAWDSKNTATTSDDGQVSGSHWDKSYGWGYIDMWESHYNRGDYFVSSVIPRNNNNVANDYKLFKGKMYANEKATLVWQRRANFASGPTGNAYNLSDLNLRLYQEGSNVLKDSDFDGDDNVHQVAAAGTMDAVIKVYAWSSSFDGASSESFALATEENFAQVTPPSLQIPSQSFSGTPFTAIPVAVKVRNNGGVDSCSVTVTRGNVSGVSGPTSVSIASIADGGEGVANFSLNAANGSYSIPFTATTTCYNETFTTSGTISLRSQIIILPPSF